MHNCPGKLTRDLQRWRKDVGKKLKYLSIELKKKGRDASSAYTQVCQACDAVTNCEFTGERYEALRHTVAGAIPRWDNNVDKHDKDSSKAIATIVTSVQRLFAERLKEWTAYTAPTGWKRQTRWERREWMRLIFNVLRTQPTESVDTTAHEVSISPDNLHDETDSTDTALTPLQSWTQAHREPVPRILHAMKCLELYVKRITKPRQRADAERRESSERKRKARWRIYAYLVRLYKQSKQTALLHDRATHREGLVSASTRNVGRLAPKKGVVYNHTKQYKPRIPETKK